MVLVVLVAACGDKTAGPGAFEVKRDLKTTSKKSSGLPGTGMATLSDAAPSLNVVNDTALGQAFKAALAESALVNKGAIDVTLITDPKDPPANGTMKVAIELTALFAHVPEISQLDANIAGTLVYKNRSAADLGKELAEVVVDHLEGAKLPANVGPPTTKVTKAVSITPGPPTCTLHEDGVVRCWEPRGGAPYSIPSLTGSKAIDAGNNFGLCGIRADGRAYCVDAWDNSIKLEARDVCGVANATAISVGQASACALLANGHVKCWAGRAEAFEPCDKGTPAVEVKGVTAATVLDTGSFKSCVLTKDGSVQCWELCDDKCRSGVVGEVDPKNPPLAAPVKGITKATNVLVGFEVCATVKDNKVTCVERGGKARTITLPEPVQKLSYGMDGACGLGASGSVYCWHEKPTATKTEAVTDVADFGAGMYGSCAITKTGEVLCWGGPDSAKDAPPKPITFRD